MPRKLLTINLTRVRLGRANERAESPQVDTDQIAVSSKSFLLSKESE